MLQIKVYVCHKTLSNRIQIQKRTIKNQKPKTSYVTVRGDPRKTIKLIKILHIKCKTITGI